MRPSRAKTPGRATPSASRGLTPSQFGRTPARTPVVRPGGATARTPGVRRVISQETHKDPVEVFCR